MDLKGGALQLLEFFHEVVSSRHNGSDKRWRRELACTTELFVNHT